MSCYPSTRHCGPSDRRGAVLVAALVCLLLVSMVVASMLQSALNSRRQLKMEHHANQAMLLLEAGVAHAQSQLANAREYKGETLEVQVPGRWKEHLASIAIHVDKPTERDPLGVRVVACYPLASPQTVQRSLEFTIPKAQP